MAKEIRWSVRADQERLEILEYWANRNKSTTYSVKLNKLFNEQVEQLTKLPDLGKPTKIPFVRIVIIRDYLLYYKTTLEFIEVLTIWDSRRNPRKFKL
jgi:plasmid stabilization system protein ParE